MKMDGTREKHLVDSASYGVQLLVRYWRVLILSAMCLRQLAMPLLKDGKRTLWPFRRLETPNPKG
jgi:hypothetical protein